VRYLLTRPGRESGLSQKKPRRLPPPRCYSLPLRCRQEPTGGELAKLALWIESHAEGCRSLLDHRLVLGDSSRPSSPPVEIPRDQEPLDTFSQGLRESFTNALANAKAYP
jgi:hypothetical protein